MKRGYSDIEREVRADGVTEKEEARAEAATAVRALVLMADNDKDTQAAVEHNSSKRVIRDMTNGLSCSLTGQLPVYPVTAPDGYVYERAAIEDYLKQHKWTHEGIRSPVTNKPMGTQLVTAVQVSNTIRNMVETGAVSGEKAIAWEKKVKREKRLAVLRQKAKEGNVNKMMQLGFMHLKGIGVPKDEKEAFGWFKQAADKESAEGLSAVGYLYLYCNGVKKSEGNAMLNLGLAANGGSTHACYILGKIYEHGFKTVDADRAEAIKWYKKMQSCTMNNVSDVQRQEVKKFLEENTSVSDTPSAM